MASTMTHFSHPHIFHRNKKNDDDGNNNELAHEEEEAHHHHHHHTKKIVAGAGSLMHKAGKIFKHSTKNQNRKEAAVEEFTEAAEETEEIEVEEAEVGLDEEGASGVSELFSTVLEFLGSVGE